MATSRPLRSALRRCLTALATIVLLALAAGSDRAEAADQSSIDLSYVITLAGMHIGSISVGGSFTDGGYAIALRGSTGGITRWMADASAWMSANGTISGDVALPARFEIGIEEDGVTAEVQMLLAEQDVMDLHVVPGLQASLDIVPLTIDHVQDVVDPMSALFIPVQNDGPITGAQACNRTIAIFDGWQRYDVSMRYRGTEVVFGARASYAGPAFACHAQYLPIAGHSLTRSIVRVMATNSRLETQLIPIVDLGILIPFQLLIGTEIGDLIICLDRLDVR